MAIDALLPVGGELIMVVAGAIAAGAVAGHPQLLGHTLSHGAQTYFVLAIAGTLGYLGGSLAGWGIGRGVARDVAGRPGPLASHWPPCLSDPHRWLSLLGDLAV